MDVRTILRQHGLWVAFLAALAPLAVLLGFQYHWLSRLERVSAMAHEATLDAYLESVGKRVQLHYQAVAESTLDIPARFLVEGTLREDVARMWSGGPVEAARTLFLVDYTRELFGNFYVYDEEARALVVPPASDAALAMIAACTPWQVIRYRGGIAVNAGITVDEHDPEHRIILKPITDQDSRVLGVAGMILEETHLTKSLLPRIVEESLSGFFADGLENDLVVAVYDEDGREVYSTDPGVTGQRSETSRLPFAFEDWTVSLHNRGRGPEDWARASFGFNVALAAVLGLTLLAALLFAMRTADRAVKLSRMKADFVSNVSHELRTPLASIRVFAEFLKLGHASSPAKVREYGEHIDAESRRLSRLIDNVLDFSRIESGRKSYHFVLAPVEDVVEATVDVFRTRLGPSFEIHYEAPAGPIPPLTLDRDAVGQALSNLLDNAVKYSGDSRRIAVSLSDEGFEVVCAVQDHGVGIARGEQKRIFERFHRVSTGLIHDVKGSGLGLSIVQHIVAAHRGRATVESELGRGTTFRLHFPKSAPASESNAGDAQEGRNSGDEETA